MSGGGGSGGGRRGRDCRVCWGVLRCGCLGLHHPRALEGLTRGTSSRMGVRWLDWFANEVPLRSEDASAPWPGATRTSPSLIRGSVAIATVSEPRDRTAPEGKNQKQPWNISEKQIPTAEQAERRAPANEKHHLATPHRRPGGATAAPCPVTAGVDRPDSLSCTPLGYV